MTVHDLGPNQAEVEWSATFEADGLPASEAAELMEGALAANCLALKQFMEAGRKSPAHWVAELRWTGRRGKRCRRYPPRSSPLAPAVHAPPPITNYCSETAPKVD